MKTFLFSPRLLLFALGVLLPLAPLRAEDDAVKASSGTPLDATKTEVVKFFGPVLKANARVRNHQILEGTILDGDLHGKGGFIIRVVYSKGRSVLLEYTRVSGQLTALDANVLLNASAGVSSWEQNKDATGTSKFYRRQDDRAIAHWTADNDGSLLVSTEDSGSFNRNLMP